MRKLVSVAAAGAALLALIAGTRVAVRASDSQEQTDVLKEARAFADALEARAAVAEKRANLAAWAAAVTGTDAAFADAEAANLELKKVYASFADRDKARALLADPALVADALLARRVKLLELALTAFSVDEKLLAEVTKLEAEVEQTFSTYRGRLDGKEVTSNDIVAILQSDKDRPRRQAAWEAQKGVGPLLAGKLVRLMQLRNEVARAAGYADFWHLQLAVNEIDPDWLMQWMDALAGQTDPLYAGAKKEIDTCVAGFLGIDPAAVMPWDFSDPFFQEVPTCLLPAAAAKLEGLDPVAAAKKYYATLGFEVGPILDRSSLYEAPGKNPHAFSTDIDRQGDVRILCNVKNNLDWHATMLHELGHALYSTWIDRSLPWVLRQEAQPFTTEGVAIFFEGAAHTSGYLARIVGVPEDVAAAAESELARTSRFSKLIFSRWAQVMVRFEKAAYADPTQDLDALWWSLVERYQGLTKPEGRKAPDWATKYHVALAPVYYHNYLLGHAFASQMRHALQDSQTATAADMAAFFKEKVFAPGKRHAWPDLVQLVTGEPLNAAYLAEEMR